MSVRRTTEELNNVRGGEEKVAPEVKLNDMFGGAESATSAAVGSIGLSNIDSMLISNYGDNEVLEKFIESCKNGLKEAKIEIKMFKLDKEKFDLGYSFVLFAHQAQNGKVYYFGALLEKTGREPLTVRQIVTELPVKNSTAVFVTADAFDDIAYDIFTDVVTKAYNVKADALVTMEGAVIPHTADVQITGEIVAKYVHDLFVVKYLIDTGKAKDLNVGDVAVLAKNGMLTLDLAYNTGLTVNRFGRSIRSDFNVEVNLIRNNQIRSFHGQSGRKKISTVSGYTEYIIGEEINPYTGQTKKVAEPMIILNEFMGAAPTLNYALLSVINATTFTNRATLRNLLIEKDAGPLNYLFNYGGDSTKFGEKISFKDPKAKPEVINEIIRNHIKPSPIFTVEIELYGPDYAYLTPFAALNNMATSAKATQDILRSASQLVGQEMTCGVVAANEGLIVPIGEFVDNEGNIKDLREIDTTFIIKYSNDANLVFDWIFSNMPASVCISARGKDPYILKLEVIDKLAAQLNITPVVTGKAVRIPLAAAFVDELVSKAMAGGYRPRLDAPNIGYNDFNNLQIVTQAYQNAAVANTGFGIQQMAAGYNIPGVNTYIYR